MSTWLMFSVELLITEREWKQFKQRKVTAEEDGVPLNGMLCVILKDSHFHCSHIVNAQDIRLRVCKWGIANHKSL